MCSIATRRGSIDSLSSRSATESGSSSSYGSPFSVIRKGSRSRGRLSVPRRRSGSQGKPLTKLGLRRPTMRSVVLSRSVPERTQGHPARPHPEVGNTEAGGAGRAYRLLAERWRRSVCCTAVHVRRIRAARSPCQSCGRRVANDLRRISGASLENGARKTIVPGMAITVDYSEPT